VFPQKEKRAVKTDWLDRRNQGLSRRALFQRLGAAAFATAIAPALAAQGGTVRAVGAQPGAGPDVLARVRLRGRPGLWNVALESGRIRQISQEPLVGSHVISGDGRLLTEGLVEHHIHLDKVFTADRFRWDAKSIEADRQAMEQEHAAGKILRRSLSVWRENQIRQSYTEDDVFNRAIQVAKIESANGTTSMRTHVVVDAVRGVKGLQGILRLRDAIRPYMDLQISLHAQDSLLLHDPGETELIRRGFELGADGVGFTIEVEPERIDEYLERIFRLAKDHGKFVDVHDQARDVPFAPPIMADKARKFGMQGQVTCSHGFSLPSQGRDKILPVFDRMKEAGVALACAPTGSVQERIGLPRSKGVLVSLITDNVGDSIVRAATADLVLTAYIAMRALGGQTDEALEGVFDMITTCPAQAMGLKDYGLREGGRADLVLWDAQSVAQVVTSQSERALVFKNGRLVAQAGQCLW
jgi:cytosine/creatinine deaminase